MGQAGAGILPAPPPVDLTKYQGTWYEQGSVKQFFSFGLVNTKAVYTPQPDGSIKVQNSGNYFGPNGPQSNITGAALVVNPDFNTRLNVGFFFGQPNNTNEPGNYWILDYGPVVDGQYHWAIVQRLQRLQRLHPHPRPDHSRGRVQRAGGPGQATGRQGPDHADGAVPDHPAGGGAAGACRRARKRRGLTQAPDFIHTKHPRNP